MLNWNLLGYVMSDLLLAIDKIEIDDIRLVSGIPKIGQFKLEKAPS